MGSSPEENALADMAADCVEDFYTDMRPIGEDKEQQEEAEKKFLSEGAPKFLDRIEAFLKKSEFVAGNKVRFKY